MSKNDSSQEQVLFLDSIDGYLEKLKDFLENDGDPNITDIHGNTLLHMAVKYNQVRIVWLLMRKGILLNVQNNIGDTALHLACKKGYLYILEEIYRRGAKIHIKNDEGKIALSYLNPKQHSLFQDFKDRFYCVGKYSFKPKTEVPHIFMGGQSQKAHRFG
jgi:ankyrin repeat protein